MLKWAIIFGIVAVIAGLLGFATLAGIAATIAKILFWVFVAICLILLVAGFFVAKKIF